MDKKRTGTYVKARFSIKGYLEVPAGCEGIILYEKDNGLGQTLVYVSWETLQKNIPVFAEDIEVLT